MQLQWTGWSKLRPVALAIWVAGCGTAGDVGPADTGVATPALLAPQKLPIPPAQVQPDGVRPTLGDYPRLYDEQALIGDPRAGTGSKPVTTWGNVAYSESSYPMGFVIDLGQLHDVSEVGVFDTYATGTIFLDVGAPGAWTPVINFSTNLWEQWKFVPIAQRTRYLHFARSLNAGVNEIVIYGAPVTGEPPPNTPPTASAGADQAVVLPVSTATLSGTASDVDGQVVSRQWTQVSGPNTATLTGATSLTATASGLVVGTYEFQLAVTDDDGASASSRTKVTVLPAQTGRGTTLEIYKSSSTPGGYGYVVYLPPGYEAGSNWPIVFFLHGRGEQGDGGTTQLKKVRANGPQSYIDSDGKDYPFILVSPQTGTSSFWSDYEAQYHLNPFIDHILATYKADRKRVYMTGLSMGGAGTFTYASLFPSKLAAIVPLCNSGYHGGKDAYAAGMLSAGLSIWAAHGREDDDFPYTLTSEWFDALGHAMGGTGGVMGTYTQPSRNQTAFFRPATGKWEWIDGQTATDASGAGPARPVLFTLHWAGTHYFWDDVYEDPKVWDWVLAQRRP